ncbi:MAG: glucokinase [Pseudomonadota bacterium]
MSNALLVDLGGSSCRVGLAENGILEPGSRQSYANAEFDSLEDILQTYLKARSADVSQICAGIAGPVKENTAQLTNHAWFVDGRALARRLGADQTFLMNDLQAQAYALDDLKQTDVTTLIATQPDPDGPRMTLCLGTGCNIAVAHRRGAHMFVPPSESGHMSLPDAPEFRALYDVVRREVPHLPIESLLSGPGLGRLHGCLTGEALSPRDIVATKPKETLDTFARLLGMAAGNLALSHMATGGVYLIGGLARAIAPHLVSHEFLAPFCDRGPYADIMARIPIHVVTDDSAALLGCARYLRQMGV